MNLLELVEAFYKKAQYNPKVPGAYYNPNAAKTVAPGKVQLGENTIVGDPNAPQKAQAEQVMDELGWKNFKVHSYYSPTNPKDKQILLQQGFKEMPGIGFVPPNELAFVNQALSQGWKYAGPGFGILPPEWYNYLHQKGYIA